MSPFPTANRLFEDRFRDAVTLVLTSASRPGRPVETTLAAALRKLFLCAPVHVVWMSKTEAIAATCPDMRSDPRPVTDRARIQAILAMAEPLGTARSHPQVILSMTDLSAPVWGLMLTAPPRPGSEAAQLWVVLEEPRSAGSAEMLSWFTQYSQGLQEFYTAVQALMALKAVHRDAEYALLKGRVESIVNGGERTFSRDLDHAVRVLEEMGNHADPLEARRLDLAGDLAVWCTQAVLGIGESGRSVESAEADAGLDAFCAALERVAARARSEGVGKPAELSCLAGILRATLPDPELDVRTDRTIPVSADPALNLLVAWTGIHELARRVGDAQRAVSPEDDARWEAAATRGMPELAALLQQRSLVLHPEASFVRNWARLWFCLVLVRASQQGGGWWRGVLLDDEKWRFRRDLSYVMRESVRFLVYGGRKDYRFQPGAFADALRTLVEQHALRVVGIPREYDLRTHLRELGESRGPEGYHFAAGHLQHVLEMYIGGHFLCSMRLAAGPDAEDDERALVGWTMAEVLASRAGWRPGAQTTAELLAAFSLAALFHDVGLLLFPRYSGPGEALCRGDPRLSTSLGDVERSFRGAGSALVARCVDDLRGADHLDTTADPGLVRWLDDQASAGVPDHALLGAWYVHRVSRNIPAASGEVVRDALRAVLLHSLPTIAIDVEKDPVAALIVLCDEMFEWEPFRNPGPASHAPGRSMLAMAGDVRPRRSRARTIKVVGLSIAATPDGGIDAALALSPGDLEGGWPRIQLRLHSHERAEAPVSFTWLAMGQNLGRVERSRHGWGPSVTVSNPVPTRLRAAGLNTRRLLGQVVAHSRHPARASLERWLFDVGVFSAEDTEGSESVQLDARNHVLHTEDIRRAFGALSEDVERVLQEFERKPRV